MNTRLEYLYRDASNFKNLGEIVFAGEFDDALLNRLRTSFHEGDWFIASQVRIPDLYFIEYPINDDDHCWHEFSQLTATGDEPNDSEMRTFADFVLECEQARNEGWREFEHQISQTFSN